MVPQSSHTNHEFLILVTRVTNVNFARESCHLPKRVMLYMKRISLLLKF